MDYPWARCERAWVTRSGGSRPTNGQPAAVPTAHSLHPICPELNHLVATGLDMGARPARRRHSQYGSPCPGESAGGCAGPGAADAEIGEDVIAVSRETWTPRTPLTFPSVAGGKGNRGGTSYSVDRTPVRLSRRQRAVHRRRQRQLSARAVGTSVLACLEQRRRGPVP